MRILTVILIGLLSFSVIANDFFKGDVQAEINKVASEKMSSIFDYNVFAFELKYSEIPESYDGFARVDYSDEEATQECVIQYNKTAKKWYVEYCD